MQQGHTLIENVVGFYRGVEIKTKHINQNIWRQILTLLYYVDIAANSTQTNNTLV